MTGGTAGRDGARGGGKTLDIGVITPIPTPYRDPFWDAVASVPGTSLHVYYCASVTADRPWKAAWEKRFSSEVLPGTNVMAAFPSQGFSYWNPLIRRRLDEASHDALIIGGYNYPTMIAAMAHARRRRIPYFLMSESHLSEPRASWRRVIKYPLVRSVVKGAAGCFPTGTWAREYLLAYGANPDRMWALPNVPDVEALHSRSLELDGERDSLRRRLGVGDDPVVLFVGRLVPFKRVDLLVNAFAKVAKSHRARLIIIGDGVERPALEAMAESSGIADRVEFRGFVEPSEIAGWYAIADMVALPSVGETWSVALLEALASGVHVVTTDTVGAAADAVNDPAVGTIVPSGDTDAFAAAIATRLDHPVDRTAVRETWAPVREGFRYDVIARRTVAAIRDTVHGSGSRHGR